MKSNKKKEKIALIVLFIILVQLSGAFSCVGYLDRDGYEGIIWNSIYEQIDSFSFTCGDDSVRYNVYFGGRVIEHNDTYKRFVSDVFVVTPTDSYCSLLSANLEFIVRFISATGVNVMYSAVRTDYSSFMELYDVIYEFPIYEVYIHKDLFPITLTIDLAFFLTSSLFNRSKSYRATEKFAWDPLMDQLNIILSIVIAIGIIAIVAVVILAVEKKHGKKKGKIKPSPIPPPTPAPTPDSTAYLFPK